jgi:hypothetical protein
MTVELNPIQIDNDDAVFDLLERALRDELDLPAGQKIELSNWPVVKIKLTGSLYDGTITGATAISHCGMAVCD